MTTIIELYDPDSDRAYRWQTGGGELLQGRIELRQGRDASTAQFTMADPMLEVANGLPLPTQQSRAPVDIWWGAPESPPKVFTGHVSNYTPRFAPGRVEVMVVDQSKSARRQRRSRNLASNEAVAIIEQVASENDLQVDVSEAELDDVVFASVIQHGETDIELVERLLRGVGHRSFVRGSTLYVRQLGGLREGHEIIRLRYGDNVESGKFEVDEFTQNTTPNLFDRDGTPTADTELESADRPVQLERTGLAIQQDDLPSYTSQELERTKESQARAQEVFKAQINATEPFPEADVDDQVVLEGFGPRYSGVWNINAVTHEMSPEKTSFELHNGGAGE